MSKIYFCNVLKIFAQKKIKIMRRLAFVCSFVLLTVAAAFAQKSPVKWSFDAKPMEGNQYEVTFTADVADGWYIYSQHLGDDGPIPTNFEFENKEKFTFVGETAEAGKKKEGYDEIFEMKLIKYSDKVTFTQIVSTKDVGQTVKGYLEYMTCNDDQCLPPTEVEFEIPLSVK